MKSFYQLKMWNFESICSLMWLVKFVLIKLNDHLLRLFIYVNSSKFLKSKWLIVKEKKIKFLKRVSNHEAISVFKLVLFDVTECKYLMLHKRHCTTLTFCRAACINTGIFCFDFSTFVTLKSSTRSLKMKYFGILIFLLLVSIVAASPDSCNCPRDLKVVCGSDNLNYQNLCKLRCQANQQRNGKNLTKKHDGHCTSVN